MPTYISRRTRVDTSRIPEENEQTVRPFLKWAGGKGQVLPHIRNAYPEGLGRTLTRYAEPFVGGGAVLFDILNTFDLEVVYISDINAELINVYTVIRDNCTDLVAALHGMEDEYIPQQDAARKTIYYAGRERYNSIKGDGFMEPVETAALFIFLNRTCFNGLYRVNKKGFFNVPMGSYKNPTICDEHNLRTISRRLQKVEIVCGDYRESAGFVDEETFVYFDPPYRPLTPTANFTSYTETAFDDEAQVKLAGYVRLLGERGAKVLVSNSDPKNNDINDDFFDDLYAGWRIRRVPAARLINCNSDARGEISELLISNYPTG